MAYKMRWASAVKLEPLGDEDTSAGLMRSASSDPSLTLYRCNTKRLNLVWPSDPSEL